MMETYKDAKSLANDATTDTDFINKTQEKYMDSMQARLNELKATGQDFWNTLLDSGAINTGISLLTSIVDIAQKAVGVFGQLGDTLPIVNSGFTTLAGTIATAYAAYKVFTNVKGMESLTDGLKLTGIQLTDFFKNITKGFVEFGSNFAKGFSGTEASGILGMFSKIKGGASEATGAMSGLSKGIAGVGIAAAVLAVAVKLFDHFTTSSKEAAEAAQKAADEYSKAQEKISSAKTTIDDNGSEFAELSKGVDQYGKNISLTTEEFERYHEICNQLANVFPNLVSGFDEQGNAVIKLKDGVKSLNDEYDKLRLTEADKNISNEKKYKEDFNDKTGKRGFGTKLWDTVTDIGAADRGGRVDDKEVLDALNELSKTKNVNEYKNWIYRNHKSDVFSNIKEEAGISGDITTKKELEEQKAKIEEYTNTITTELNESGDKIKTAMQSWLTKMTLDSSEYPEYKDIDDNMISKVSTLINSVDYNKLQELDSKGVSSRQYVKSLLDGISGNEKAQIALDDILKLDDSSSVEDMKKAIDEDLKTLSDALQYDDAAELKVRLKLDDKQDIIDQYDEVVKSASNQLESKRKKQADAIAENIDKAFEGDKDKKISFDTSKMNEAITGLKEYKRELEDELNSLSDKSNVDFSKLPSVKEEKLSEKGWNQPQSKLSKIDTTSYNGDSFDKSLTKNKKLTVEVTPVLENGKVLTPDELNKYMENLFKQDDILSADKVENGGKGLVVNMFDKKSTKELDEYREKMAAVKQEHAELSDVIDKTQEYVKKGDSDGLAKYFNDIYKSVGDDKLLKSILKSSKQAAKQSKDLEKNTNKTTKNNKNLEASEKRVKQYIKDNNINTQESLELLKDCIDSTDTWADAISKFELKNINTEFGDVIQKLEQNLTTVKQDIDNINEATQASHTSMGLTKDEIENVVKAFSGLDGYSYDKLFESTAEGVHLNVQELDRLNGEYRKFQQAKYDTEIDKASNEYGKLCEKINETTDATERKNLIDEKNKLADQIQELRELQSRYEGLTNAVTRYQQAKANGEEGSTYDSIAADTDSIKELYDKGLVGTNQFKAAVQMMTSEDLSGQGTGKFLDVYKKKSEEFFSYFTENAEGVERFLKKLQTGGFSSQNKDGSWNINADIEEISKKFDMDQSIITEMFKKLNDYGFDVDFKEETDNLKKVRKEAEKARDALDEPYKLKLESDDPNEIADITKQAKKLRSQLVATYGEGSDQVKNFDKQLDYLKKKQGDLATADWTIDVHSSKGLEDLQKQVDALNKKKNIDLKIDFESESPEYINEKLKEVGKTADGLKDKNGVIDVKAKGASETISIIQALLTKKKELDNPALLKIDTSKLEGETQKAIQDLQEIYNKKKDLEQLLGAKKLGVQVDDKAIKDARTNLNNLTKDFASAHPEVSASLNLDSKNLKFDEKGLSDRITSALNNITPNDLVVKAKVDSSLVEGYKADSKTMKINGDTTEADKKLNDLKSRVANANPTIKFKQSGLGSIQKTINDVVKDRSTTVTIVKNVVEKKSKAGNFNGNAHAQGTTRPSLLSRGRAFVKGTWGAAKSGMSLVGELGREYFAT